MDLIREGSFCDFWCVTGCFSFWFGFAFTFWFGIAGWDLYDWDGGGGNNRFTDWCLVIGGGGKVDGGGLGSLIEFSIISNGTGESVAGKSVSKNGNSWGSGGMNNDLMNVFFVWGGEGREVVGGINF